MSLPRGVDLCQIPLAVNPTGAPPNFVDPPSQWIVYLAVGVPFAGISFAFVGIRLWTNAKMMKRLQVDDYLYLAAFILMTTYVGLNTSFGPDSARHQWDTPVCLFTERYAKTAFAVNIIVGPALWAPKAAIITLYIRLFQVETWLRWTSYISLVVLFLVYWQLVSLATVYCTPRNGGPWDITVLTRCGKLAFQGPLQGAIAIAADIFILCLPLPVLAKLNLPARKKWSLGSVFLVGTFAIIASCISMYYRVQIFKGKDTSWNSPSASTSPAVEGYITIICNCAPAVYSFWTNYFVKSALYSSLCYGVSTLRTTRTDHSEIPDKDSYGISKHSKPPGSTASFDKPLITYQKPGKEDAAVALTDLTPDYRGCSGTIVKSTFIEQSSNQPSRM